MLLLNAFSLNMVHAPCTVEITPAELPLPGVAFESCVGHADTARVFSGILGQNVACSRKTVTLAPGDVVLVGQYRGPRLPEGATELPEGAAVEWLLVKVRQ